MPTITRQERERRVLALYNQGKTIREIAKEVRMSFRDIGAILNKTVEDKAGGIKQQDDAKEHREQEQQQYLSLSTQAYKLFSDRKTPLEVAIALNLRESEATRFYKEYWKLKQLHNLNTVYEETKGDIEPFLRLYKLSKVKGIGIKHVVNLLTFANEDLPALEKRFKRLRNDISMLQFQKCIDKRNLYKLNNQISSTTRLLNSYRISCIREKREIRKLYNEKARLETIVRGFKNNNEEYLKIKQTAEEKVKSVLIEGKILLKFATFSVIESLRTNPEEYNFVLYNIPNSNATSYSFNSRSLMFPGQQQQQQQSFIDSYTALILEEVEKLYNKLTTELTNRIMTAATDATAIRSSLLPTANNRQKLTHKNDRYETE